MLSFINNPAPKTVHVPISPKSNILKRYKRKEYKFLYKNWLVDFLKHFSLRHKNRQRLTSNERSQIQTIHKFSSTLSTIKSNYRLFVLFTQNIIKAKRECPQNHHTTHKTLNIPPQLQCKVFFFQVYVFKGENYHQFSNYNISYLDARFQVQNPSRKQSHNWIGGNFPEVNAAFTMMALHKACSTWKCKMSPWFY